MRILILAHHCITNGSFKNENIKGCEALKEYMQESKEILDEATSDIFAEFFEANEEILNQEIISVENNDEILSKPSTPIPPSTPSIPSTPIVTSTPSTPIPPSTPSTPNLLIPTLPIPFSIEKPNAKPKKSITKKPSRKKRETKKTPLKANKKTPTPVKKNYNRGKREKLSDLLNLNVLKVNQELHFRSYFGILLKSGKIQFEDHQFTSPSQFTDHILRISFSFFFHFTNNSIHLMLHHGVQSKRETNNPYFFEYIDLYLILNFMFFVKIHCEK